MRKSYSGAGGMRAERLDGGAKPQKPRPAQSHQVRPALDERPRGWNSRRGRCGAKRHVGARRRM